MSAADEVVSYLTQKGLSPEQAQGVASWMQTKESGLDPNAFTSAGGGEGAYGIAQWRGPRLASLMTRPNAHTLSGQLDFLWSELQGPEKKTLAALQQAKTADAAKEIWARSYERPEKAVVASAFPSSFHELMKRAEAIVGGVFPVVESAPAPFIGSLDELMKAAEEAAAFLFPGGTESAAGQIHKHFEEREKFFAAGEARGESISKTLNHWFRMHPISEELSNPALLALTPGNIGVAGKLRSLGAEIRLPRGIPEAERIEPALPSEWLQTARPSMPTEPRLREPATGEGELTGQPPSPPLPPASPPPPTGGEPPASPPPPIGGEPPRLPLRPRQDWGDNFPGLLTVAGKLPGRIQDNPDFRAGRTGDPESAAGFARAALSEKGLERASSLVANQSAILVPVRTGKNLIPLALANQIGRQLGLPVEETILGTSSGRRGMGASASALTPTVFSGGQIAAGGRYILVDDFVTQGGTLADLRGYIQSRGGKVVGMLALRSAPGGTQIAITKPVLAALRKRFPDLERWWRRAHGYGLGALTDSEGRLLLRERDPRSAAAFSPPPPAQARPVERAGAIARAVPGQAPVASPGPVPKLPAAVSRIARAWEEVKRSAQISFVPMAAGENVARSAAKSLANAEREARFMRTRLDDPFRSVSPEGRRGLWEDLDSASTAAVQNRLVRDAAAREKARAEAKAAGKPFDEENWHPPPMTAEDFAQDKAAGEPFLAHLSPEDRRSLEAIDAWSAELWEEARRTGVVDPSAPRIPWYATRAMVTIGAEGIARRPTGAGAIPAPLESLGTGLGPAALARRGHLTAEESEAAARRKFGPSAQIVRDIRAVPLALERFAKVIAVRRFVNDIKSIGEALETDLVTESYKTGTFRIDHPAFTVWEPRITVDQTTGIKKPMLDAEGNPVFDSKPIWISKIFEGPLRAVAATESPAWFQALMRLKAASMAVIMQSPLIHNQVEWGRAMPLMPGKVLTLSVYRDGARVLEDQEFMRDLIRHGYVPIGHRGYLQDITGMAEEPQIEPGRGMLAQGLREGLNWVERPDLAQRAAATIDRWGDYWHGHLLWDQVAKLQAGLAKNLYSHMIDRGFPKEAALAVASHYANRFAGALPREAMSQLATRLLNGLFFSRSFTFGNLGIIKDMVTGLPRDVRAQMSREVGDLWTKKAVSFAKKKAIGAFMLDVMLYHLSHIVLRLGIRAALVAGGVTTLSAAASQEGREHLRRLGKAVSTLTTESPLDALYPMPIQMLRLGEKLGKSLSALDPTSEQEPGRRDRVLIGHQPDGTGIYALSPVGRVGHDLEGWFTRPGQTLQSKLSQFARPVLDLLSNDQGFGRKIYSPRRASAADYAADAGRIMWHLMKAPLPMVQINALYDLISGRDRGLIAFGQLFGPALGFSISRGAPGGPAVGLKFAVDEEARFRLQQAAPRLRAMVQAGRSAEAMQQLRAIGIDPGLARYYLRVWTKPQLRLSPRTMRRFRFEATPEERRQMERFRHQ